MTIENPKNAKLNSLLYSCSTCSKWVSEVTAIIASSKDHIEHFCNSTCHELWSEKQKAKDIA